MTCRCVMGMETEYGMTVDCGQAPGCDAVVGPLSSAVTHRVPSIGDHRSSGGLYLANGARFYFDCGHPEYATPECATPREVVAALRAGERLLERAAADAAVERGTDIALYRSNVDYDQPGVSWGCHESYQHLCDPARLPPRLLAHLVSRLIYTGAGGFHPGSTGVEFVVSPRAFLFQSPVSSDSTRERGIFHTRDESLSGGTYHRLHVICGESLCSDVATLLKLGTTALIVAAFDAGACIGDGLQLEAPVRAIQTIAADPTCTAAVELKCGRRITAIELQRQYLRVVEDCRVKQALPSWAGEVCDLWAAALDHLEARDAWAARNLDWAMKQELYRNWVGGPEAWGGVARIGRLWRIVHLRLTRALRHLEGTCEAMKPEDVVSNPPAFLADEYQRIGTYLASRQSTWEEVREHLVLRRRLCEIDVRFGQLGGTGIFEVMARQGHPLGQVVMEAEIERAVAAPPHGGRAMVRGRLIRQLFEEGTAKYHVGDWRQVWDGRTGRIADFSDPFATQTQWSTPEQVAARRSVRELCNSFNEFF